MEIVNMNQLTKQQINQAAKILSDSLPLGWATLEAALAEIDERLVPENTMLAAMEDDLVIGWGGILEPQYNGNVFELHPLAVRADKRNQGVGSALVTALEDAAKAQGGLTLYLGADDEQEGGETSLANTDLYNNLPDQLRDFRPGTHQSAFYFKLGFKIVGVMPDANGIGKPDIILAKKLVD